MLCGSLAVWFACPLEINFGFGCNITRREGPSADPTKANANFYAMEILELLFREKSQPKLARLIMGPFL